MIPCCIFALFFIPTVLGHGRMVFPTTRILKDTYENDPTGSSNNGGNNNNAWVCRHSNPTPSQADLEAGKSTILRWDFSAKHVGDCDVYLSYDVNAALADMTWFKIANLYDCRLKSSREDNVIQLPSWLPSGPAVLRFGWYAVHTWPNVEFYSQCSDVTIIGTSTSLPSSVVKYPLINPPIFPLNGNDGIGYPNRFPPLESYMTGPPCANGYTENSCALTAAGTEGFIDVGDSGSTGGGTTPTATGRCGETAAKAQTGCGAECTTNSDCGAGETCQIGVTNCIDSGSISNRCGTDWPDANSRCGTPCEATNDPCPSGEGCYADMTTSCSDDTPTYSTLTPSNNGFDADGNCISGAFERTKSSVPEDPWCTQTCEAYKDLCDPDICACVVEGGVTSLSFFFVLFFVTFGLF